MKLEALDGFVCGCGASGKRPYPECRVTRTLDRVSDCTCETCTQWVEDGVETWLGDDPTDLVCALLGFCGCGDHDEVERQFFDYLNGTAEWWRIVKETEPRWDEYPPRPDADYLTMYLCDALGWTEHGGSVGGAWLTDDGRKALANLAASLAPRGESNDG